MKAAYDCGVNFFDTAEVYAGGESEIVMGEAIKHFGWNRNDLVISTKVRHPKIRTRTHYAPIMGCTGLDSMLRNTEIALLGW